MYGFEAPSLQRTLLSSFSPNWTGGNDTSPPFCRSVPVLWMDARRANGVSVGDFGETTQKSPPSVSYVRVLSGSTPGGKRRKKRYKYIDYIFPSIFRTSTADRKQAHEGKYSNT